MIPIDITAIQKLLRKALLYRLMTNVEKIVSNARISHQEVSARTGRKGNWFNDAYNNNEDIQISSLAKILSVVNDKTEIKKYQLTDLFDEKVLRIARVIANLSDEDSESIVDFLASETNLFIDLIGDWGSLNAKKKLSNDEQANFEELQKMFTFLTHKEDKPNE